MSNQEPITTEGKTLKEAAEAYLEHLASGGGVKPSTIQVYGKALDLAIQHFGGERKLNSILVPHVGRFYASEQVNILPSGRPKAAPTVKQIKRVFRQMMQYAQAQGWIPQLCIPKAELQHAWGSGNQHEVEAPKPVEPAEDEAQADPQN